MGQYDRRNLDYPLRAVVPTTTTRKRRTWRNGKWHGDQGKTSSCTGFAATHLLKDGPVGQGRKLPNPAEFAYRVYRAGQQIDPWAGGPTRADDGSTIDAIMRILKAEGFISSFHFAYTIDDVILGLLEGGPVNFGTRWFSGMSQPSAEGIMKPTGAFEGGHAYKADAINLTTSLVRVKNSWGLAYGKKGFAYISLEDIEKLLNENGECLFSHQK